MSESDNVKIWERIIDVQKHFNDIKSKNQTLFMSVITAALVATGYLYTKDGTRIIHIFSNTLHIHFYTLPLIGAFIFTIPFYVLDCHIYQIFLKGAVECGKDFEKNVLQKKLTSIWIEEVSHDKSFFLIKGANNKLKLFYIIFAITLLLLFWIFNIFPNNI